MKGRILHGFLTYSYREFTTEKGSATAKILPSTREGSIGVTERGFSMKCTGKSNLEL
jgi:hypothetical protein